MNIYAVKISDISKDNIDNLCLYIDSDKKYKIERFINKKDKVRTLIGEILLRTIISGESGIINKYIKFDKNQYGKPYLKDYPHINFNISHSGDYVLCAIDNKPVGIDVEKVTHIEYEGIAERFFTAGEFNYIINQEPYTRLIRFYEIWTLKESYIKCCGQGLSLPLKSFSIDIDQHENIKAITDGKYKEHIFKSFDIESDYKMAVCSLNKKISDNIIIVDQNNLIKDFYEIAIQRGENVK